MRRAMAWLENGFLVLVAVALIFDLISFQTLVCQPPTPHDAEFCDLHRYSCRLPSNGCEGAGTIAFNKIYLRDIALPDWRRGSVLDYAGVLLQGIGAFIGDSFLFISYVVTLPLLFNPPVWLALYMLAGLAWYSYVEARRTKAPQPLERLAQEKALGDAGKASPVEVHQALIAAPSHADERFKD